VIAKLPAMPVDPDPPARRRCFPTASADYFVAVTAPVDRKYRWEKPAWREVVAVHAAETGAVLFTLPPMPELREIGQWEKNGLTFDRRLHVVPAENAVVTVLASDTELRLRRLDFAAAGRRSGPAIATG